MSGFPLLNEYPPLAPTSRVLNVNDHDYFRILEDLKHDEDLLMLSGKAGPKKQRHGTDNMFITPWRYSPSMSRVLTHVVPSSPSTRFARADSGPSTSHKGRANSTPIHRGTRTGVSKSRFKNDANAHSVNSHHNSDASPHPASTPSRTPTAGRPPTSRSPSSPTGSTIAARNKFGRELMGRRVLRYWPDEGGWNEAIITGFNAQEMRWCLTYNYGHAGTEKWEWYNVAEPDPESCILTDEKVDLNSYATPVHETRNWIAPPSAIAEADFKSRLELNAHNQRGLEGMKVELDQRRCAVVAEEEILDEMDRLVEKEKDAMAVALALVERRSNLDGVEEALRRELECIVDV